METSIELRVLGGLALRADGVDLAIGGPKQQQLLSVLVAHVGHPVSIDRLIEALWVHDPPKAATATSSHRSLAFARFSDPASSSPSSPPVTNSAAEKATSTPLGSKR